MWSDEYLDFSKERFVRKTYKGKKAAFGLLIKELNPHIPVFELSPSTCIDFLRRQSKKRSGYAANKDRKNLATGWEWGNKFLEGFPQTNNPFRAVDKFPEIRTPRYVPPEEDFWKVYNIAQGQDKVILLTALNLAARRGEIFNLTWDDVDFGSNQVRLWTRKRVGGHKEPDWLPMMTELRNALE